MRELPAAPDFQNCPGIPTNWGDLLANAHVARVGGVILALAHPEKPAGLRFLVASRQGSERFDEPRPRQRNEILQ
jgi:hypothetical protein